MAVAASKRLNVAGGLPDEKALLESHSKRIGGEAGNIAFKRQSKAMEKSE